MQSACVRISNTPSAPKVRWDKTTELLHISQSAISRHMAQLEDELRRKGIRSWALFPMWQNKRESPRLAKIHRINFFSNKANRKTRGSCRASAARLCRFQSRGTASARPKCPASFLPAWERSRKSRDSSR